MNIVSGCFYNIQGFGNKPIFAKIIYVGKTKSIYLAQLGPNNFEKRITTNCCISKPLSIEKELNEN